MIFLFFFHLSRNTLKNKMKSVLYPIFLEVCDYTTDSFWEFIFKDIAFGICPYGAYIDNNAICCKFKGKEFSYNFRDKSAQTIFKQLSNLLQTNLNIRSVSDIAKRKKYIHSYFETLQPKWAEIKKKSIRYLLVENYVLKLKNNYKLTHKQTKLLLSNIMIGFQFKLLSNQDVEYDYKHYEIVEIKGVVIKDRSIGVKSFCHTLFEETEPVATIEKISLEGHWIKLKC